MSRPETERLSFEVSTEPNMAAAGARPKAFRRPPHWVGPNGKSAATPAKPSATIVDLAPKPIVPVPRPAEPQEKPANALVLVHDSEPGYGIMLIAIVVIVNMLVALGLSQTARHTLPQPSITPAPLQQVAPQTNRAPDVTLFTTPLSERRTARPLSLEDETDSFSTYQQPTNAISGSSME